MPFGVVVVSTGNAPNINPCPDVILSKAPPMFQADLTLVFQNQVLADGAKPFELLCECQYTVQSRGKLTFGRLKARCGT